MFLMQGCSGARLVAHAPILALLHARTTGLIKDLYESCDSASLRVSARLEGWGRAHHLLCTPRLTVRRTRPTNAQLRSRRIIELLVVGAW